MTLAAERAAMFADLRGLYRYRELLWLWVLRELKVRYKQTVVGATWALLQPLAMMLMFTIVFSFALHVPSDGVPYPLFSYAGLLSWNLFQTGVTFAIPSPVNNLTLVTRTHFPREILPIGTVLVSCVDFAVAASALLALMAFYGVTPSWQVLWVPLLLVLQVLLAIGVSLLGAAINVLFRDVRFLVPLALQIWLYATPVIYPASVVPSSLRPFYMLNPMAAIVESYRRVLLHQEPPVAIHLMASALVTVLVFVLGFRVFKRLEVVFADVI